MGKIENELNKQMGVEGLEKQAQQCKAIYDKLKEMDGGHLWDGEWSVLVKVCSRRNSDGKVEFYRAPTAIGEIFLKGLATDKHQDSEKRVRVLCFCDTTDNTKGVLLATHSGGSLWDKRQDIDNAIRCAFYDQYEAEGVHPADEDEDEFEQVLDKLAAGYNADLYEYELFWETTDMV